MKTSGIHIAIFPIGSIVKFKKDSLKRADGSSEYYKLIWLLCRQSAITRISILQKSDWDKLSDEERAEFDPRGVIFDAYTQLNLKTPSNVNSQTPKEAVYYLWDAMKYEDKPDFGLGFPAQGLAMINIPNFLPQLKDPKNLCSALNMTVRYSGPLIHYLNQSEIPWYMIATDPRYCRSQMRIRDMVNPPIEVLAQYNDTITLKSLAEYDAKAEETEKKINVVYSSVEKLNLVNEKIIPPDANERNIRFAIVAMQSSYGKNDIKDYRFNILKDWVFKYDCDQQAVVYGKWSEIFTRDYPQFKGFLEHTEIDKVFTRTRYTLVIPIRPHWVTSKYAEMLRVGVVPFLHPDYDTQFNVIPADHFIRVKSPEDFYQKMKYLDNHPDKRIKLVKQLQVKLLSGVRRGEFFIKTLNHHNTKNGIPVKIPFNFDETLKRKISSTKSLF